MLLNIIGLALCLVAYIFVGIYRKEAPKSLTEAILEDDMKYIRVFDGRLIEYSDCGDNNGDILLNIHGFGMTGKYYQDVSFHCEFAESRGLRLISPSMPCFGRSDCYPMNISRKLSEWADDMSILLDSLGHGDEMFYLAGTSLGAAHASAVAAVMPHRVRGLMLLAPLMPLNRVHETQVKLAYQSSMGRTLLSMKYGSEVVAGLCIDYFSPMFKYEFVPDVKAALAKLDSYSQMLDSSVTKKDWGSIRSAFIEDGIRAHALTSRGYADNMKVVVGRWDFNISKLGEIVSKNDGKVVVTSCKKDTTNPPGMQYWLAGKVPGALLMNVTGNWGHLHFVVEDIWVAAMKEMLSR